MLDVFRGDSHGWSAGWICRADPLLRVFDVSQDPGMRLSKRKSVQVDGTRQNQMTYFNFSE